MTVPHAPVPCLSVVVPCFNEEETIAALLHRVVQQPWTAEVIVVDDGSTDVYSTLDWHPRVNGWGEQHASGHLPPRRLDPPGPPTAVRTQPGQRRFRLASSQKKRS